MVYMSVWRWSTAPAWSLETAGTSWRSSCRASWAQTLPSCRRCSPTNPRGCACRWTAWTPWASTWSSSAKFANSRCRAAACADTRVTLHRNSTQADRRQESLAVQRYRQSCRSLRENFIQVMRIFLVSFVLVSTWSICSCLFSCGCLFSVCTLEFVK